MAQAEPPYPDIIAHKPVMLQEMLQAIAPAANGVYLDCTFGAGGYSQAILQAANCKVVAIDRDPNVRQYVDALAEKYQNRFEFKYGCFGDMAQLCEGIMFDGIVLDIGVSSMQIDEANRGFSFRHDAMLDMRMSSEGRSAADLVNELPEAEIANILWEYGEERASRKIAASIIKARAEEKITTTMQLRNIIHGVIRPRGDKSDPATKSFQALRIVTNDELGQLRQGLAASVPLLKEGGKLVMVAFHSLEDRIIKQFLQKMSGAEEPSSRHTPSTFAKPNAQYLALPRHKAIKPSAEELRVNKRARSAVLRHAVRTNQPLPEHSTDITFNKY